MNTNKFSIVDSGSQSNYRVKPSMMAAIIILVVYMAVFSTIWIINNVDYKTIGKTIESTKLHYAMPTIVSSFIVACLLTIFGWWRIVLFDKEKNGPKWIWLGVFIMLVLAILNFSDINFSNISSDLLLYSILGGIGVGFGEEIITRGSLLVGLNSKNYSENKVLIFSSLIFAAIHLPNMLFGSPVVATLIQLVLAFIIGSLLYITRRLSGSIFLPIFLHGFWDSSLFLPGAVGAKPSMYIFLIYPISIICIIGYLRYNKSKFVS